MNAIEDMVAVYFRAWLAKDEGAARETLERCCTPDVAYRDPKYVARGLGELAGRTRRSHEKFPRFALRVTTVIDGYEDLFRYEWVFVTESGVPTVGLDIVERAPGSGKIASITSFFGPVVQLAEGEPLRTGPRWGS